MPWLLSSPMFFRGSTNVKRADARTMSKKVVLEEPKPRFLGNVLNDYLERLEWKLRIFSKR